MKKLSLFMLIILLMLLMPFSLLQTQPAHAESTQFINAEENIFLRDAPSPSAKKLSLLENLSKVTVLSKEGQWSYIKHNGNKGYILSKTLTTQEPKKYEPKKAPVITNGLLPKANRSYTYEPSLEGGAKTTYKASVNPDIRNSVSLMEEDFIGYTYIENENSFELGVAYSDVFFFSLSYPMKEKSTIYDTDYGIESDTKTEVTVESTSTTLKTKAGTFKNVVVIKYPNGSKLYLAKDYGIIRVTNFEGEITTELVSVK
ncbi:SH3 domain-containing protein [Solibacillus sp. FSL W8-0474]|uniref:SH3 domain-containing protein n=1 Tax=Solibacillus sp. FSL W8-0474 TaxID=2975336 RepID=UPI0030F5571E